LNRFNNRAIYSSEAALLDVERDDLTLVITGVGARGHDFALHGLQGT
jgi:hypothetical protein